MEFDSGFTRSLLEIIGGRMATLVLDSKGTCVFASSNLQTVIGIGSQQLVGKNFVVASMFYTLDGNPMDLYSGPMGKAMNYLGYVQSTPFFGKLSSYQGANTYAINVLQINKGKRITFVVVQIRKAIREVEVGEMKTLFLSFAAHQLKTPSSVVKGFLELMIRQKKSSYTEEQWNYLVSAYESNEHLITVSNSLLNLARLEGGLIEPRISELTPEQTIEHKVRLMQPIASLKEISIQIKAIHASHGQILMSDESFFTEILGIILGNAIKHSPNKCQILLTYEINSDYCEVHVIDSGPGLPKATRENLFKVISSSGIKNENHGLGLYMAHKYVSLLNGRIGLRNSSIGTDFYFIVPNHMKQ